MKRVKVIVNPASGKDVPVLNTLNDAFGKEIEWDVSVTLGAGDARRFAARAIDDGVDIVAVYGGDGTVSAVADALAGHRIPLAIFPGGTGNGVARFLNLPFGLHKAASLLKQDFELRAIDLGRVNEHTFILRADLGFMAATGEATTRIAKDHLGKWAYVLSTWQHRDLLRRVHYELQVDGEALEVEAVMILIVNIGAVAFGHKAIVHDCVPDDGLLDLLILTRNDAVAIAEVAMSAFLGNQTPMLHRRMKQATIRALPDQHMALDGELLERTPAVVEVVPGVVQIVVPSAPGRPQFTSGHTG